MKQTFTKESITMHEGEVLILKTPHNPRNVNFHYEGVTFDILYSTGVILGTAHIDRKEFVKPVDVEALADSYLTPDIFLSRPEPIWSDHEGYIELSEAFQEGYNANPNEFTREDMQLAFKAGAEYINSDAYITYKSEKAITKAGEQYVDNLRPLSIPESVTIENNQVISVVWDAPSHNNL